MPRIITIIINCYNSEKYLSKCLDSVLNQTFSNFQIIVFDNSSTDGTANIVKQKNDNRIKYIFHKTHTSLGTARQLALSYVDTMWYSFLDSDDLYANSFLEKIFEKINISEASSGIYFGKTLTISDNNFQKWENKFLKQQKKISNGEIKYAQYKLANNNFIPLVSAVFKSELILKNGGINSDFNQSEDYDLILRYAKKSKVTHVAAAECFYRMHEGNLTHKQMKQGFYEGIKLFSYHLPRPWAIFGILKQVYRLFRYIVS